MANRDWSALDWTPNLSFAPQTEFQLARSSLADSGKGADTKFAPNAQNAALLAALGYTGPGLVNTRDLMGLSPDQEYYGSEQSWSPEALKWLTDGGYNVGVAHDPGTSPGGRPEHYALTDPNGQFVQGQADPTTIQTDTMMDQITPFLMMAGPFLNAAGVIGGPVGGMSGGIGADGVSLGSGATGGGVGSFGAVSDGLTSLASQGLSPEALGLTGGITPGMTAADLAYLTEALPGAVGTGAAAGGIGTLGGAESGVSALGPSWSPEALGLTGGITPGVSAAELAALSQGIPEALGSGLSSLVPDAPNLPDVPDYTPQTLPDIPNNTFPDIPTPPSLPSSSNWLQDILSPVSNVVKPIADVVKPISDAVGGGQNLAGLIGAGLGAASGGGTQTKTNDPWEPAQQYLKNILGDAERMRANLAANPYTPQQTQQYQNAFAGLDQARNALPGLLNWGQGAMQRQSTVPSYQQLFGGGLLGQQAQQPTAQAGGAGGLLGNSAQDRMKALMARGQGLIG